MKVLADGKGAMVEYPFGERELRAAILSSLPRLAKEIDDADHVYSLVSTLDRAVMHALDQHDEPAAREILEFVGNVVTRSDVHPDILNAVGVSFVKAESFRASAVGMRLWREMPERLRELIGDPGNGE
jgi:hypothetical protein